MIITIDKKSDSVEVYNINDNCLELQSKVYLNHSEILILEELLINRGSELLRDDLIAIGWPSRKVGNNSLNVSIMNLRKKISFCSKSFNIKTLPFIGYKLILDSSVEFIFYEELTERLTNDNRKFDMCNNVEILISKCISYFISLSIFLYGVLLFNALYIRCL
ncbi:winged helix-turn-helix domain-containing protein [Aliivibrio fischeri]|uniref:winged helix-turn-helix domain-containing protein n=1 Tax=Aliivibrio fischeri TaxID=668 RepID=UPI0012DA4988|nr:helix-turn-helix domain-containing protein [Aliivibrio fischeri]MUJ39566.1 hypothetical protein [Aliivibrio fischeri]